MNELIRKIAVPAGIFCGVVLLMSLAAVVMMHAGETEVPYGGKTEGTPVADASAQGTKGDKDPDKNSSNSSDVDAPGKDAEKGNPDGQNDAQGTGAKDNTDMSVNDPASGGNTDDSQGNGEKASDSDPSNPGSDNGEGNTGSGTQPGGNDNTSGNGHIIVIDAAHQATNMNDKEPIGPGSDKTKVKVSSGAEGVSTGTPEYKLTLAVAQLLRDELTKRGYDIIMVRESNDVTISDAERAQLANNRGEIIIHIHGNADESAGIKGIMAFYPASSTGFVSKELSGKCKDLCKAILDEMAASTGATNWGAIEHESLTALNWTKIPAAHVEIGYLSNAEEDKLLQTADYRAKIVQGIADGIDKYFGE